ncbi:hypothetical protein L1049_015810 [Liquidambar formosana]|uniref:Disease resistance protein At4g27190-like leucine-rich repeats domain-containing protein n=1 Tax=Liquidambar formosana TaxID=63359 RepID=A0AAP0X249_LIQFO
MNQMRGCLIKRCDEIETIIDGNTITTGVLKFLEKMYIENASNLERIWEGPVHFESLVLLTTLTLQKCPKLKKLFSNGMIQQLSELQHLTLEECSEIEEIIMESENVGLDSNALPRLRTLLPFNNDNATKLGSIECEESWWNNIQQNVAIKQRVSEQKVLCSNPHVVLLLHIKPATKVYSGEDLHFN